MLIIMNALNGVYSDIYTLKTKIQQGFIRIKKKSGRKLDFEDFSKSRKNVNMISVVLV